MPPRPQRDPNVAERKIYFHKALVDDEPDFVLDRDGIVTAIQDIRGTPQFYVDEGDETFLCAVVDRPNPPHRIRLYRVRRRNLPEIEGDGNFGDLPLNEREGLAESIHIILFEDGVIGSEYNHYGPRITTFAQFAADRCGSDFRLRQFVRSDVIGQILAMAEIRRFRVKVSPAGLAALQAGGVTLNGAADATDLFRDGRYVELVWGAEPGDQRFRDRVKRIFRDLRNSGLDPTAVIESAQVYGRAAPDDALEELDLLRDRLVITREIEKESPRYRTLDTGAAYGAVEDVYGEIRNELDEGGTLRLEP
jgi:hypothetical protein